MASCVNIELWGRNSTATECPHERSLSLLRRPERNETRTGEGSRFSQEYISKLRSLRQNSIRLTIQLTTRIVPITINHTPRQYLPRLPCHHYGRSPCRLSLYGQRRRELRRIPSDSLGAIRRSRPVNRPRDVYPWQYRPYARALLQRVSSSRCLLVHPIDKLQVSAIPSLWWAWR